MNMLCILLELHCFVWWVSGIDNIVSLLYTACGTPFVILVWFLLEINSSWMAFVQLFTVTNNSLDRLKNFVFTLSYISISSRFLQLLIFSGCNQSLLVLNVVESV